MTILNSLDKRFIVIRDGVELFYFGSGCIADYYKNSIAYLDELDIKIVLLCKGTKKLFEISSLVTENTHESPNLIYTRIESLYKKGVIVFRGESSEKEIILHGVKGLYYPKDLVIELTNICNYECPFCYKNAKGKGDFISDKTIDTIDHLIHNKVYNILLTGGEPTLHPNYLKYINIFTKYAKVYMISNGSILYNHDPEILRKLDLIQFTIYGCDDAEYQKMTGSSDGFTRLSKSIEFAKQNGINTKAAITLCDSTLDHIELFVKTAISFDIKSLRIGIADVFGRGKYLFDSSNDFSNKRMEAYDILLKLKRKYRNKINFELPNINVEHVTSHDDLYQNVYRKSLSCGCGSEYLIVSQNGEIRPCQMLPEAWFSIKNKNAFWEHINGNFHTNELYLATKKYYTDNNFVESNISPCQALESLMNLEEKQYVSQK